MRELLPVLAAGLVPFAVLLLVVIGTAFSLVAWQPPIVQIAQFGTANLNSSNGVTALSSDTTGIYAGGFVGLSGRVGSNVTPSYLFVNRYDLSGHQVWTQHFGNPNNYSSISGVGVGADGVYVAGSLATSSFVRKYDLNGNQLWTIQPGRGTAEATSISVSRGVFVGGINGTRYLLRDYDFNGGLIWTRPLGNFTGRPISTYADAEGVYVTDARTLPSLNGTKDGTSLVQKYYANGTLAWTDTCSCDHTRIAGDSSGIYLTGTVMIPGGGAFDGFLGRYDFNGKQLWTTSFSPHSLYGSVARVEASADSSGVYIAAIMDGGDRVMKYDGNGNRLWSVQFGADAITTQAEGIYLGGSSSNSIALMSKTSSLIFFGVNPPFSFVVLGLLVAAAAVSILWFRRRWKKRFRPPSTSMGYRSRKIPAEVYLEIPNL